jgi:hypothetical protein
MTRRAPLLLIAINAALYAGLVGLYPLAAGLLRPRQTWAQQANGAPFIALVHIGIPIALSVVYGVAIQHLASESSATVPDVAPSGVERFGRIRPKPRPPSHRVIIVGWLLFSLIALFGFPGESADVFDYLFRGRMMSEYSLSPLAHTPFEIKERPFHRYVSWSEWVDAYGPLWEYASAGVSWLGKAFASPDELLVRINQTCEVQPAACTLLAKYVTGYRLFAIACAGACGMLVWSIVRRQSPRLASLALLIWFWNPLVIVSTAIGAHNDALMLVFVLLALWLMQRQHWLLGLLALIAAAHVKITALVMLPVMCLWLWRRIGLARAAGWTASAAAIALPISYTLYAPLGGWTTLPRNLFERSLLSTNSLGELLYLALRDGADLGRRPAQQIVARVMPLTFMLAATLVLRRFARTLSRTLTHTYPQGGEDFQGLIGVSLVVSLLCLFLGSFWFQPWYLMWPVALVALLPDRRRVTLFITALSASALCAAVISGYLRAPAPPIIAPWAIGALTVLMIWLPPVITAGGAHILRKDVNEEAAQPTKQATSAP